MTTAGQRFRDAVANEKPLQVLGAINAYAAKLAEHSGAKAAGLSGGRAAGCVSLPSAPPPNLLRDMDNRQSPLPRLTPAFWGWALLDIVGVLVLAVGAAYLMEDRASILPGFPANTLQAWICIGGGIVTVFIAAVEMLVEVMHAASRGKSAANDGRFS